MKQNHSRFLIPGILLLGVVLRAPFTTLSTVLSDIAASFGVEVSSLGLLTSLPPPNIRYFSLLLLLAGPDALGLSDSFSES